MFTQTQMQAMWKLAHHEGAWAERYGKLLHATQPQELLDHITLDQLLHKLAQAFRM